VLFHPIIVPLYYPIEAISLNHKDEGVMVAMLLRLIKSNSAKGWLVWLGPHLKEKEKDAQNVKTLKFTQLTHVIQ